MADDSPRMTSLLQRVFVALLFLSQLAATVAYAQIVVIDEPYEDERTIVYSGNQGAQSGYQRGYDAGFDDGYSTGYVDGVEHGRDSPYNRYYGGCEDVDDFDEWERCYGRFSSYPGVYPVYPVVYAPAVPYPRSQYSYVQPTCRMYGYSRYC